MYTFIPTLFGKIFQLTILFSELIRSLDNVIHVQHAHFKKVEAFWRIVLKFGFVLK